MTSHPTEPANGAMMEQKTQMREGFEAQRKVGQNVDWFTWQIAWHDALFTVHDIAGDKLLSASAPAAPQGWKPELLYGPGHNVCWTQDMVPRDERIDAVVISHADYERLLAAAPAAPQPSVPCKGLNCGSTDGVSHSPECEAQHAAAVAGAQFILPAVVLDGERAAFESAAFAMHGKDYPNLLERRTDDAYRNGLMRDLWRIWQARAASPQAPKGDERGNDVDIADFLELIDDYQCAQKDGTHDERAKARIALMNAYRSAVARAAAPQAGAGLTDEQIRRAWLTASGASILPPAWAYEFARQLLSHPTGKAEDAQADDARDAARYRWLRDKANFTKGFAPMAFNCEAGMRVIWDNALTDEWLDDAIDAAMAAAQPERGGDHD